MVSQRTKIFLTEVCERASSKLKGIHPHLNLLQWKVVVVKELSRHPIWEIHVKIDGPDGVIELKPMCAFQGKPKNLDDEVSLMIWCIATSYRMRVQLRT